MIRVVESQQPTKFWCRVIATMITERLWIVGA